MLDDHESERVHTIFATLRVRAEAVRVDLLQHVRQSGSLTGTRKQSPSFDVMARGIAVEVLDFMISSAETLLGVSNSHENGDDD